MNITPTPAVTELDAEDLPVCCPPHPSSTLHPRVYLRLDDSGSAQCPYCGAHYQLKSGVVMQAH